MPRPRGGTTAHVERPTDVLVVGGGVVGCASALALAEAGLRPLVLERAAPGAEASSAAAGILGAQVESHAPGPMADLCLASRARWAPWAERLRASTAIDVEHRASGVLRVETDAAKLRALEQEHAWQRAAGLSVDVVDGAGVRALEPSLAGGLAGGVRFADDARVDPPSLLRALAIAAARAGARFRAGTYVRAVETDAGHVTGVRLDDGSRLGAGHVVLAAGSWATLVDGVPLAEDAVRPARGQIVELQSREPPLRHVVFGPGCYLAPRDDGRTLVGSTLEFVGYRREVTARAVRDLLDAAVRLCPPLADATLGRAWSSFRPWTERGLPLLGPTAVRGLVLATGHFRNGILLAPVTADVVRACVLGERPPVDLAPFAPPV